MLPCIQKQFDLSAFGIIYMLDFQNFTLIAGCDMHSLAQSPIGVLDNSLNNACI